MGARHGAGIVRRFGDAGRELLRLVIGADPTAAYRANPIGNCLGRACRNPVYLAQCPRPYCERTVGGENRTDCPSPQRRMAPSQDRPRADAVSSAAPAAPPPAGCIGKLTLCVGPTPGAGRAIRPPNLLQEGCRRYLIWKRPVGILGRNRIGIMQRTGCHSDNPTLEERQLRLKLKFVSPNDAVSGWPPRGLFAQVGRIARYPWMLLMHGVTWSHFSAPDATSDPAARLRRGLVV